MQSIKYSIMIIITIMILSACGGTSETQPGSANSSTKALLRSAKTSQPLTAASYQNLVQQLYVAYFGRPADPTGLANFESALLSAGAPNDINEMIPAYQTNAQVKALVDSFGLSAESKTLYAGASTSEFVTAIYSNVLGRQPEQAGLTFWSDALTAGTLSQGDAALSIMAGALSNTTPQGLLDGQLVRNRIATAEAFTGTVASQELTGSYAGTGAAWTARNMLSQVTAGTDVSAFQPTIQSTVSLVSENSVALNAINQFRAAEGPGALTQNVALFSAASAHAQYMATNGVFSHFETSGLPNYTGEAPGNRAEVAGYPDFNVQEEAYDSGGGSGGYTGQGNKMVSSLIATVYHRAALLYQYAGDIGIGLSISPDGTTTYGTIEYGYQNSALTGTSGNGYTNLLPYPTTVSGSYIGVYPLAGQTDVALCMEPESPSPFPGYTQNQFASNTGYPLSVAGPTNSVLTVTTFTVTPSGSSAALPATLFTGSDPNFGGNNNFAFIVASQPFLRNTTYTANFVGLSNGTPVSMTWSFTTGSGT